MTSDAELEVTAEEILAAMEDTGARHSACVLRDLITHLKASRRAAFYAARETEVVEPWGYPIGQQRWKEFEDWEKSQS